MDGRLIRQLALDYCCGEDAVRDGEDHFTAYRPLPGRRRFDETADGCFLKLAVFGGKLLATGRADVVAALREELQGASAAWFMDAPRLRELDRLLAGYGWRVAQAHGFYTAGEAAPARADGLDLRWYEQDEIAQFEGDERFTEAFSFAPDAPDVLGLAALREGRIVGMAGASADSPLMWQIGINTAADSRSRGVGTALVALLAREVLARGVLPFYGTAMSHLASQRVALKAGFVPSWAELITERCE